MTAQERLKIIINFKGFGNPFGRRKFCFVGIEEAIGFDNNCSDIELDKYILNSDYIMEYSPKGPTDYDFFKHEFVNAFSRNYTSVYEIMAKIIAEFGFNQDLKKIRDKYLFTCDGLAFQMNLYPFGKKDTIETLPNTFLEKFDIVDFSDYKKRVLEIRFPKLFKFWSEHEKNFLLTICFGKEYWDEYKRMFNLENIEPKVDEEKKFQLFNNKILLTDFFINPFFSEQKIIDLVKFVNQNVEIIINGN